MRGDEAKEACPQIQLVQVPVARGKADLNSYKGGALIAVSYEARRCGVKRLLSTLPHYHAVHFIE